MLTDINPKLPMRDKNVTREFYINKLGFKEYGSANFDSYLMMEKYLNKKVERKYLEEYIFNGNLMNEYLKPYTKSNFSINE